MTGSSFAQPVMWLGGTYCHIVKLTIESLSHYWLQLQDITENVIVKIPDYQKPVAPLPEVWTRNLKINLAYP